MIVPKQEANGVWRAYHDGMGHPSSERTLAALRKRCYWPRMTQDVKEWTEICLQCVCAKAGLEVRAPLLPITTSYPFEVVGVDYLSLGRPDDQYPYILVMTDLFSKYALAVPTRDQSANTMARALYSSLIQTFGCPERILTDWGAAFESLLIRAVPALRMSEEPHHGIPPPGKRSLREIQPNRVEAVKLPNRDRPGTVAQPAAGPHPGI